MQIKLVYGCGLAEIRGGGGVREVATPDTHTLDGIIPADYQQGGPGAVSI